MNPTSAITSISPCVLILIEKAPVIHTKYLSKVLHHSVHPTEGKEEATIQSHSSTPNTFTDTPPIIALQSACDESCHSSVHINDIDYSRSFEIVKSSHHQ